MKSTEATTNAISFSSSAPTPAARSAGLAATAAAGPERDWVRANTMAAAGRDPRSARVRSASMRWMRASLMPWMRSIARTAA